MNRSALRTRSAKGPVSIPGRSVGNPSHSVGKASYVPACALAAVAYGADGLCIESHVSPSHGIGDDPKQALTPAVLRDVIAQARSLFALRRQPQPIAVS